MSSSGFSNCPHCDRIFISKIGLQFHLESHSTNGQVRIEGFQGRAEDLEGQTEGHSQTPLFSKLRDDPNVDGQIGTSNPDHWTTKKSLQSQDGEDARTEEGPNVERLDDSLGATMPKVNSLINSDLLAGQVGCDNFTSKEKISECVSAIFEKLEQHKCKMCPKSFGSRKGLYLHKQNVHQEQSSLVCNICLKTYSRKQSLSRHVEAAHNKRRYNCQLCSKSFVRSSYLRTHKIKAHEILS